MYWVERGSGNEKSRGAVAFEGIPLKMRERMAITDAPDCSAEHTTWPSGSILQVAVPVPVGRGDILLYDYYPPETDSPSVVGEYNSQASPFIQRGTIIKVPLGSRTVWGIVMGITETPQTSRDKVKRAVCVADSDHLSENTLSFLIQLSRWTLAPFGLAMKLLLNTPAALESPVLQTHYHFSEGILDNDTKLSPQRRRVCSVATDLPPLPAADLAREAAVSPSIIWAMAKCGQLQTIERPRTDRMTSPINPQKMAAVRETLILSDAQKQVAKGIADAGFDSFKTHLLDGVTGSGKTEVYFDLVARCAAASKQCLILLPEIALTKGWQKRFERWFGFQPAIWHSSVTPAQRRRLWRAAASGQPLIVAGARSALFLPFSSLGLIVVDEEHDGSYKQEDYVAYHGRDMAILRAKIHDIPIVLASATPSLESWVNAGAYRNTPAEISNQTKYPLPQWHYWQLTARYGSATLPKVSLIDMRIHRTTSGKWLSEPLVNAISERLAAQQQTLLFLNRRGYAPMSLCDACGHRRACHQCDSLLVSHKITGKVHCHICGFSQPLSASCDQCGTEGQMKSIGPGVERLAEEASLSFLDARVAILSSDMVSSAEKAESFFAAVAAGEIDIIIGTQMAAKGHHFPLLTLAAVIDADLGLDGGDLRAAERTYQLLWQVAGRAGRGTFPGEVLIQTFQPDNPVMQALSAQSSLTAGAMEKAVGARNMFMSAEAEARRNAKMPPFGRLASVTLTGSDIVRLEAAAVALKAVMPSFAKVDVFGPAQPPLGRVRGQFRLRYLVRTDKDVFLQKILKDWLNAVKIPPQIRISCDIDPYSFM